MEIKDLHSIFAASNGVYTDSRTSMPGAIFFALKGDHFDGNAYAEGALEKSAAYAVIDNPAYKKDERYILVENSLRCMQDLARFHREQFRVPVLGITGSNGKTTSKELIACVLSRKYKVAFTRGNLNNHIGVPLTLLDVKPGVEFVVVEMGANHQGEIAALCEIARPGAGIVTNVGKAHLEGFGSFEGVVKGKTEMYHYLKASNGELFLNLGNDILRAKAQEIAVSKVLGYGEGPGSLIRGEVVEAAPLVKVRLIFQPGSHKLLQTRLAGTYNLENILAAAAIGIHYGVSEEDICSALEAYTPSNNRSQLQKTGKNTLLLDYYNANPSSMMSAIHNFKAIKPLKPLYILGDMLELGDESRREHEKIIDMLDREEALLVGPIFSETGAGSGFVCFKDSDALVEYIQPLGIEGRTILIKGSRGIQLEKVVPFL